jgi:predicted HicB family RNase H-like nuclease
MFKIEKELKSANIPRTIRFTEALFEELNQAASENGISFNHLVLQCCKYALDNREK